MKTARYTFSRADWFRLALVAAVTLGLYFPVLANLTHEWLHNPNFSHGFLIPPLAGLIVWERREKLAAVPLTPSNWGLLGILGSLALLFLGSLGAEMFLSRVSLVFLLSSIVLFFFGWIWLRKLLFPLLVLLLMIPLPQIIFNQIAFPLQLAASQLACSGLSLFGVPVLREGNLILLPNNVTLEVAEACSGIRSLSALMALGVAYGRFFEFRQALRALLLVSTIPVAVASNSIRIAGTGLVTFFLGEAAASGFFHALSGWMVFLSAFVLLVILHRLFRLLWRGLGWAGAR